MNMVGVQFTRLNQLFHFRNGDIAGLCHGSRKIAGGFPKHQVAQRIAFPGFYNGK